MFLCNRMYTSPLPTLLSAVLCMLFGTLLWALLGTLLWALLGTLLTVLSTLALPFTYKYMSYTKFARLCCHLQEQWKAARKYGP